MIFATADLPVERSAAEDGAVQSLAAGSLRHPSPLHRIAGAGHLRTVALGAVVPVMTLIAWELCGRLGLVRPTLLPPPSAVLHTLVDLGRRGELWEHIEITLLRVFFGF